MKTEREVRARLRAWIVERNGKIRPEALTDQTPILEQRIISSLQLMDLILFVEQLSGRPLELEQLQTGAFQSIDALYRNFFEQEVGHAN